MNTNEQVKSTDKYSAKWQERFNFFDTYGAPNDPRYKAAFKALVGFKKRMRINANMIAFFFGPIYLFVLGLWKKNLAMLGIILAVSTVSTMIFSALGMDFPKPLDAGLNMVFSLSYALTTNYSYYLKEVKGEQSWNPFQGMRL